MTKKKPTKATKKRPSRPVHRTIPRSIRSTRGKFSGADFISAYADIAHTCGEMEGLIRAVAIKAQQARDFGSEVRDLRECLGFIDGKNSIIQESK